MGLAVTAVRNHSHARPRVDLQGPKPARGAGNVALVEFKGAMVVDGFSATDVEQGYLNDCYFWSALGSVTHVLGPKMGEIIKQMPNGNYSVRFKFFDKQTQTWKQHTEHVDAKFYINGLGRPLYGRAGGTLTVKKMELWPSLIEKAFAQWKGGYQKLNSGGYPATVMEALTGRKASYQYITKHNPERLWKALTSAVDEGRPASVDTFWTGQRYAGTKLFALHSYSVLGYSEVNGVRKVKLRNPWGMGEPKNNGKDDGIFELTLEEAAKYFNLLSTVR